MTLSEPAPGPAAPAAPPIDLRRAPLAKLFAIDFRTDARDFWADEAELWDRLVASWAGLDDAAWRLPGAAPSDAGGPDWSLLDHVGHLVDWLELAADYTNLAIAGGAWPSDDDYDGGDFDRWNERRRERFAHVGPGELRRRLVAARDAYLPVARRLDPAVIRGDAAWGWVYNVLHGHDLDHLRVIEPWAESLRERQAQNDPFDGGPQPLPSDLDGGKAAFWADEAAVTDLFREAVLAAPDDAWTAGEPTPGWTLADHVGHLAAWFDETATVITGHRPGDPWPLLPPEGVDAWNAADIPRRRGRPPEQLRAEFEASRARLVAAVEAMSDDDWLDPEAFSWAYEDLHGHVRAHLAMVGPYAARAGWPEG